ncbi:hypothetical protein EVAR_83606_1 [Eumeta japonica]|uniref:Uncharacterized protein n=1 Tax=Eumeta variegata TaxID=151549 RepID=A0A4C1UNG8_EUMVA|nr:hypothetical protein EVAR_83606_1 [Eumeta japonica]
MQWPSVYRTDPTASSIRHNRSKHCSHQRDARRYQPPGRTDFIERAALRADRRYRVNLINRAVYGSNVILQAPINSGTEFYSYKGTFSTMLFILAATNYNIVEKCELNLPTPTHLQERNKAIPHLLGEAFALTKNMMKPFRGETHAKGTVERMFNYRLSRHFRNSGKAQLEFNIFLRITPLSESGAYTRTHLCVILLASTNRLSSSLCSRQKPAPLGALIAELVHRSRSKSVDVFSTGTVAGCVEHRGGRDTRDDRQDQGQRGRGEEETQRHPVRAAVRRE